MRFRRRPLPPDVALDADERILARAAVVGGGEVPGFSEVIATSHGLWLPDVGRLGWHLVSRATWDAGALAVVAARETGTLGHAVLLTDEPVRRVRLAEPGRVPEIVHRRVEASIRSRHRRDLPGGAAWFVQRAVPGRDGIVLQVRADPGTDSAAVARIVDALGGIVR